MGRRPPEADASDPTPLTGDGPQPNPHGYRSGRYVLWWSGHAPVLPALFGFCTSFDRDERASIRRLPRLAVMEEHRPSRSHEDHLEVVRRNLVLAALGEGFILWGS